MKTGRNLGLVIQIKFHKGFLKPPISALCKVFGLQSDIFLLHKAWLMAAVFSFLSHKIILPPSVSALFDFRPVGNDRQGFAHPSLIDDGLAHPEVIPSRKILVFSFAKYTGTGKPCALFVTGGFAI